MKHLACLALFMSLALPHSALAEDLKLNFADPAWTGKSIPSGQICKKFGGNGATPALRVENIPAEADAIVLEFSDKSYGPMNDGGHGKIGFRITPGAGSVVVPSFAGETFTLPEGFFLISKHKGWSDPGAYLPPCSGGQSNKYYVTVKAVKLESEDGKSFKKLASELLVMGFY